MLCRPQVDEGRPDRPRGGGMAERSWTDPEGASRAPKLRGPRVGPEPASRAVAGGWVGIAANPASGRGKGRAAVARLAVELERLGLEARIAWSLEGLKDLVAAAADRAEGPERCRCLVAVGG